MTDYPKALAAAREAAEARKAAYATGDKAEIAAACVRCANTQDNLIAALDAQVPVGQVHEWVSFKGRANIVMPHEELAKLKQGALVYGTPVAPAAVPDCDMGAMCIGCTPRLPDGRCPDAPAAAVPADVIRHATVAVAYLDGSGGMPAGLSRALYRLRDALTQQPIQPIQPPVGLAAVPEPKTVDFGWTRIVGIDSLPPAQDQMTSEDVYLAMPGGEIIIGHCLYRPKGATYSEPAHGWFSIKGSQLEEWPIAWHPFGLPRHALDGTPLLAAAVDARPFGESRRCAE